MMFVLTCLSTVLAVSFVEAVPVVFKESTPNGEAIVAISSSDPNVEKYFTRQFETRSGFTRVDDEEDIRPYNNQQPIPPAVHSSYSVAIPGKALAGAGRSFASASSGSFLPIFAFPIGPEGFGFNNFALKDWVRNVESFYNPTFPGNSHVNTVTAVNDNGHIYGKVNSVSFDNRANLEPLDSNKHTGTNSNTNKKTDNVNIVKSKEQSTFATKRN